MNLFEIFLNIKSKRSESWIETTATFTGQRNKAAVRTKIGYRETDYYEYEITYPVGNALKSGFYTFYPLPKPDLEQIKGTSLKIKYNKKKPYLFETVK